MKKTKRKKTGREVEAPFGFHLMAKPTGPRCNLQCRYCFYLEKKTFFPKDDNFRMSDEVLEAYTRQYIESQPGPAVDFAWQGGEPTLPGIGFYRRALELQKKYNNGKRITNSLQTNGTLIDEAWCEFFARNNFLIGLSLDGPEAIHDAYRLDKAGNPTSARVQNALRMMLDHGVELNVLASINSQSSLYPLEVYGFFKERGVRFIQFIPIVERTADPRAKSMKLPLAVPPSPSGEEQSTVVTPWTVAPDKYGLFLARIFEDWVKNDVGRVFVMNFEWALGSWFGAPPGVCLLAPRCGKNLILEHNGDVYSCDHFMYPDYRLGNILRDELTALVRSHRQAVFGSLKETGLPGRCLACDFLFACRGGCPKHRFINSPAGEPGLNYLCPGYGIFYSYVNPYLTYLTNLIRSGLPATKIMAAANQGLIPA
ncbi:MAG: anaerobic sulfatase maturase [Pseudomonadota bacterium]